MTFPPSRDDGTPARATSSVECDWCEDTEEIAEDVTCPKCWPAHYGVALSELPATPKEFLEGIVREL